MLVVLVSHTLLTEAKLFEMKYIKFFFLVNITEESMSFLAFQFGRLFMGCLANRHQYGIIVLKHNHIEDGE